MVPLTFSTMIDFPFIDFPYVDAWLSACSVIGDVRTAAWVIDAAAKNKRLVPAHVDRAVSEARGAKIAALLVAAGVTSENAVFCVATKAAVLVVASTVTQGGWHALDANGNTPLHAAAMRDIGVHAYAALLGATGLVIANTRNGSHQTPLMVAMASGNLGPATALLDADVDVDCIGLAATAAMAALLVAYDRVPTKADYAILRSRRGAVVGNPTHNRLPDALDKKAVLSYRAKQSETRGAAHNNLDAIESLFAAATAAHTALIACVSQYDH